MPRRARAEVRALGDSASSNRARRPAPAIAHQCPVALPNQMTAVGNLLSRLARARVMSWVGPESEGGRTPGRGYAAARAGSSLSPGAWFLGYAT